MLSELDFDSEWLEADGLGGFASGTVGGARSRRYHALLLIATTPPTGRFVLVNGFEAWITTPAGTFAISSQHYSPDVTYPDGQRRIDSFTTEPWPTWRFRLEDGTEIEQSICVWKDRAGVSVAWRLCDGGTQVRLKVRPLLSGRDYHALHHENPAFRFDAELLGPQVTFRPYVGVPATVILSNGSYSHDPTWYRNFLYAHEQERGLDDQEDLASPGVFEFDLAAADAHWIATADGPHALVRPDGASVEQFAQELRDAEHERRAQFATPLLRSADAYLVKRGGGKTVIAGYPWFTDWGRDTFIAMRGLCLATGRLDDAREILLSWAGAVSEGMLPNRFPDHGESPEYNSVDASLWYVVAVDEFLRMAEQNSLVVSTTQRASLADAVQAIVSGYARGTRFGIHADGDGLLACGVPGVQLTWMDAKVGDYVVTPRIGKPVEIQALWLGALAVVGRHDPKWRSLFDRCQASFLARFVNDNGYLNDVVDVDHQPGTHDRSFRPNQVFAAGGLPVSLVGSSLARRIIDSVEQRLWTPMGLRSLAPGSPGYAPHYEGDVWQRDTAYHQGTVWPWLAGPFVEAWLRCRGNSTAVKQEARRRFVEPLLSHLRHAGIGHVSEIADAEPPHSPRGCPWQAWSLGELLRVMRLVLADGENDAQCKVDTSVAAGHATNAGLRSTT